MSIGLLADKPKVGLGEGERRDEEDEEGESGRLRAGLRAG